VGALCFPANRILLLCDDRGRDVAAGSVSTARGVRIDRPGRAQVFQETGQIDIFAAGFPAATCPPP
jgi:hypothetical protein